MLRIECLEIDDHVLGKIESKHNVSFTEVEEVCLSDKRHVRRGREGAIQGSWPERSGTLLVGGAGEPGRGQLDGSYRAGNDRQQEETLCRGNGRQIR